MIPGFSSLSSDETQKIWQEGWFVFDANTLLGLYRSAPKTAERRLDLLVTLGDRLWIPHQVWLEFYKGRQSVLDARVSIYDELTQNISTLKNKFDNEIRSKVRKRHPYLNETDLLLPLIEADERIRKYLSTQKAADIKNLQVDQIIERLTHILNGKVGDPFSQAELMEIYKLGEVRYSLKIPPGYEDSKKDTYEKYGDLVLWMQILNKAKNTQKPIVWVTEDVKPDWRDGKTDRPRHELVQELFSYASTQLLMYTMDNFLDKASEYLQFVIDPNILADIKDVQMFYATKIEAWSENSLELHQLILSSLDQFKLGQTIPVIIQYIVEKQVEQFYSIWVKEKNLSVEATAQLSVYVDIPSIIRKIVSVIYALIDLNDISQQLYANFPDAGINIETIQQGLKELAIELEHKKFKRDEIEERIADIIRRGYEQTPVFVFVWKQVQEKVNANVPLAIIMSDFDKAYETWSQMKDNKGE